MPLRTLPGAADDLGHRKDLHDPRGNLTGVGDAGFHVPVEIKGGDTAEQGGRVVGRDASGQSGTQDSHGGVSGNVEQHGARIVSGHDRLFEVRVHGGLCAGQHSSTHLHALGAEHHRRGGRAGVADPARRDDGKVDVFGHQGQ